MIICQALTISPNPTSVSGCASRLNHNFAIKAFARGLLQSMVLPVRTGAEHGSVIDLVQSMTALLIWC